MPAIPITALYAGLMGLLLFALDAHVSRERQRVGVSLYDGGDNALAVAIRRHGNFTEHVPIALVLLAVLELGGAAAWQIHALGGTLSVARLLHPFGLNWSGPTLPRVAGAVLTGAVTAAAAVLAILQFLRA